MSSYVLVLVCLRYGIVLGPHGLLILPSIAISRLYAVYVLYLLLAAYAMLCVFVGEVGRVERKVYEASETNEEE